MKGELTAKKRIGNTGESIARKFLEKRGFRIIAMNYRKPWGEIDIIGEKAGSIRFIEVKTVSRETLNDVTHEIGGYRPEEMVHEAKLRKIARTAEMYMNEKGLDADFQIDVVCVFLGMRERRARCVLYEQVL